MRLIVLAGVGYYHGQAYYMSNINRLVPPSEYQKYAEHFGRLLRTTSDGRRTLQQTPWRTRKDRHSAKVKGEDGWYLRAPEQRGRRLRGAITGVLGHNLDSLILTKSAPRIMRLDKALPLGRLDELLRMTAQVCSVRMWQSTRFDYTGTFKRPVMSKNLVSMAKEAKNPDTSFYQCHSFGTKDRGEPAGVLIAFDETWKVPLFQEPIHHLRGRLGSVRYLGRKQKMDMSFNSALSPGDGHSERDKDAVWDGALRLTLSQARRICQIWSIDANGALPRGVAYRPWVGGSSIADKSTDNGERHFRFLVAGCLIALNTYQSRRTPLRQLGTCFPGGASAQPTQIDFLLVSRRSLHAIWRWAKTDFYLPVRRPGCEEDHRPLLAQLFRTVQLPRQFEPSPQRVLSQRWRWDRDRLRALLIEDKKARTQSVDGTYPDPPEDLARAKDLLERLLLKLDFPEFRDPHESAIALEYSVTQVAQQVFGVAKLEAKKPWITASSRKYVERTHDAIRHRRTQEGSSDTADHRSEDGRTRVRGPRRDRDPPHRYRFRAMVILHTRAPPSKWLEPKWLR